MIAGKQIDPIDLSDLPPAVAARITTHNRFLGQAEVPDVVASADFMVAPYLRASPRELFCWRCRSASR